MIVTSTVNTSIDRLARLHAELKKGGGVFRLPMPEDIVGGKGPIHTRFTCLKVTAGR